MDLRDGAHGLDSRSVGEIFAGAFKGSGRGDASVGRFGCIYNRRTPRVGGSPRSGLGGGGLFRHG